METPKNHRKLLSLMHRFDGDDKQLERALGVSRSTIWRLKNGKISKVTKYINILESEMREESTESIEAVLDDLRLWSNGSRELREILISLHIVLQESATT